MEFLFDYVNYTIILSLSLSLSLSEKKKHNKFTERSQFIVLLKFYVSMNQLKEHYPELMWFGIKLYFIVNFHIAIL